MVKVAKLNETIDKLEIQSKEIEDVVNKQKKLEELIDDVRNMNREISQDREKLLVVFNNIDELLDKNKNVSIDINNLLNEKIKEMLTIVGDYNKAIVNLSSNVSEMVVKVNDINTEVVKKLNEIISENHKLINEFQNALDAKIGLLKSDLLLENRKLGEELQVLQKKGEEDRNLLLEMKGKMESDAKRNRIFFGIFIVFMVANFILGLAMLVK